MKTSERNMNDAEDKLREINKKTGRNMPQAIATAVVLIAIILACLLTNINLFALLVVIFMALALWELRVDFAVKGYHIPVVTLWITSTVTLCAAFYCANHMLIMSACVLMSLVVAGFMASFNIRINGSAQRAADKKILQNGQLAKEQPTPRHSQLTHVAVTLFTVLYITLLGSMILIALTLNHHPVAHAIMVVFLPALSDTGGLVFGAWLGKHKLSPRISPKKSYEGLFGSVLFAMIGAFIIFACTYDAALWSTRWWMPVVVGVLIGVVGTFGDLCASMLKRDIGIKDMGHLLKGHGGVLDRVDSILLCAPFMCLVFWLTGM